MQRLIRVTLSFEKEQYTTVRRVGADRRVSIAHVVREAVAARLREEDRREAISRALSAVGAVRGTPGENLGEEHDLYLDEGYGDH